MPRCGPARARCADRRPGLPAQLWARLQVRQTLVPRSPHPPSTHTHTADHPACSADCAQGFRPDGPGSREYRCGLAHQWAPVGGPTHALKCIAVCPNDPEDYAAFASHCVHDVGEVRHTDHSLTRRSHLLIQTERALRGASAGVHRAVRPRLRQQLHEQQRNVRMQRAGRVGGGRRRAAEVCADRLP